MVKKKDKKRKVQIQKIVWWFVLVSLVLSIGYVILEIVLSPSVADPSAPYQRVKGDYVLMLAQCVLGVLAMFLPSILRRRAHLAIPSNMLVVYAVFLYCAIFLGEVRRFYYIVPHWDTILHTFSGAMLGALGFSFITFLNKTERIPVNLSPAFIAVFTFRFGITLGVLWEFYEFICDGVLHTNMQKFALESGEPLLGRAALLDTMKDLFVDAAGAIVISIIGYISLKFKKGWIDGLLLKRKNASGGQNEK